MEGRAIDVRLRGFPLASLRDLALAAKRGGVGFYPRSNFVHMDTGRRALVAGMRHRCSRAMKNEAQREPETAIHRLVAAAREGREPRVIARLFSGWVLFGERQFLRGYALLLPDPVVPTLNALGAQERAAYMQDVARLGDAS